jgi:hypothetical protein
MLNHEDDLIWHSQLSHPYFGEIRCCVDSIGLPLAFLALPPAGWQQLEDEFGEAAVAFRFMKLLGDIDAFLKSSAAARPVRLYADRPVIPPAPPADPFESVMQFVESTVTKAAASVEAKVRVRRVLNKNGALQLLVITSTIVTRDRLFQRPAFRNAMETLRDRLLRHKIKLQSVSVEAQEVIDRVDHLITAEEVIKKGEAPRLRFDHGPWSAIRQLWPFGKH